MKKFLLAFLSFLPSLAFAQQDIGNLIFRDILKMSSYPGSPFSGNIINDIVMFLFIPTVFIIVIIYTLAGRLTDNTKIDLLLSVAFYLFIVFGGYYSIFALLAGPYFLFLIIIMGLFYFFLGHFGLRRAGTGGSGGRAQGMPGSAASGFDVDKARLYLGMGHVPGPERKWLETHHKSLNRSIHQILETSKGGGKLPENISELMNLRDEIEIKLHGRLLGEDERRHHM